MPFRETFRKRKLLSDVQSKRNKLQKAAFTYDYAHSAREKKRKKTKDEHD